jgi:DNA-nicking Smr family endonuclease
MKSRRPPDRADHPHPPERGRRNRRLSSEEEFLWRHTASTTQPVPKAKPRVTAGVEAELADAGSGSQQPRRPMTPPPQTRRVAVPPEPRQRIPTPAMHRGPPPLADFERRKARRIASGGIEIDARLDLHGARQSEAHHRLKGFLLAAVAKGYAMVLVITGKGGKREQRPASAYDDDHRDHGILRRSVPMWLAEPDMRALVVSYTTAHARHGGEGALYIQLRRRGV